MNLERPYQLLVTKNTKDINNTRFKNKKITTTTTTTKHPQQPVNRQVTQLLRDLVYFVAYQEESSLEPLDITMNTSDRERPKLLREQNILKQVCVVLLCILFVFVFVCVFYLLCFCFMFFVVFFFCMFCFVECVVELLLCNPHTYSPTHPPTHPPTNLLTHPPTYSPTHPPTHPPTHLLTHPPTYPAVQDTQSSLHGLRQGSSDEDGGVDRPQTRDLQARVPTLLSHP